MRNAVRPRASVPVGALILVVALCAGMALAGGAVAARPGLDPTFGEGGIAELRPPAWLRHRGIEPFQSAVAPDGSTYEIARDPHCGVCTERSWLLVRFDPRGRFDHSFGRHGVVSVPVAKSSFPELAVDRRGRPIVDWRGEGAVLERFARDGRPDRGFGEDGILRRRDIDSVAAVRTLPGGELLVVGYEKYRGGDFTPLGLTEIRDDGKPVAGFGRHHLARVSIPREARIQPTVLGDGSIVFFGPECCQRQITLTRVSRRGVTDTRFDAVARRSLGRLRPLVPQREISSFGVAALLPGRGGALELLGGARRHGFEVRVRGDGRVEASFGRGGIKLLRYPVDAATAVPGGGAIAISKLDGREGILSLGPLGGVERAFDGRNRFDLPGEVDAVPPVLIGGHRAMVLFTREATCAGCQDSLFAARLDLAAGREGRGG